MSGQIYSWSFSRYNIYKQCPFRAKLQFIEKIKEPPNPTMERGAATHDIAERYIKGVGCNAVPGELAKFPRLFRRLRRTYARTSINPMVVEDSWGFTRDWGETAWDDWANCWLRVKLDCGEHASDDWMILRDWKTGKYRPQQNDDYVEQLELYALAALLKYPHLEFVFPRLVYLDTGDIFPSRQADRELMRFGRGDVDRVKVEWERRVEPMFKDKAFAPRPNNLCRWCFFRADNKANGGGQCKF